MSEENATHYVHNTHSFNNSSSRSDAAILGMSVRWARVVEREFGDGVEIDAGSAPRRGVRVARAQHVDDDARDACVRLTQRLVVRVGAAGHLRDLSEKCAAFDARAFTNANVKSNCFSIESG